MSKVTTGASMSLDGYIAGPDESGFDKLFQWYGNGDVTRPTTHADMTWQMTQASIDHLDSYLERRRRVRRRPALFDITSGWGGIHPLDKPIVVLSHSDRTPEGWTGDEPFTFVSEGIESGDREGEGDRRRQGRRAQRRHDRQPGAQRRPARRGVGRSRAGAAGRGHAVLRRVDRRPGRPRGPGLDHRGQGDHPPALPRPSLCVAADPLVHRHRRRGGGVDRAGRAELADRSTATASSRASAERPGPSWPNSSAQRSGSGYVSIGSAPGRLSMPITGSSARAPSRRTPRACRGGGRAGSGRSPSRRGGSSGGGRRCAPRRPGTRSRCARRSRC